MAHQMCELLVQWPQDYSSYIWENNTARGDCKYARNAAARNDYSVLCQSFNDPSRTFGIMQVCVRGYVTSDGCVTCDTASELHG
jgi:hypothetical protein